jgi:hypothetical protein
MSGLVGPSSPALAQLSHAEMFAVMIVTISLWSLPICWCSDRCLFVSVSPTRAFPFPCLVPLAYCASFGCGEASVVAWDVAFLGENQELQWLDALGELAGPSPGNPSVESKWAACITLVS